jgi:PAS domain S-box-containing protein
MVNMFLYHSFFIVEYDEELVMKAIDENKCKTIEKINEEPIYANDSILVDNKQKEKTKPVRINFDNSKIPLKAINGEDPHSDKKGLRIYNPDGFKILVDNADAGICIVHEDMRHAYVNKKYCEITGYSDSELKKIRMMELISAEERKTFKKMYQLSFNGETNINKKIVATVIRKDGKMCILEWSGAKLVWKGQPAVQGIIRDITASIEREKTIKEKNRRLNNQIEKINAKLLSSSEKLEQKQSELLCHKRELENINEELLQTNHAMSVLARNIDKKKREVEQRIAHAILTKIIPLINDLMKEKDFQKYLTELEVLSLYVKRLAPQSYQYQKTVINLSTTEMRIAILIKNGMSSQNIADALNISLETVKTHRKKIRRKLKIKNTDVNLTSYLKSTITDSL